MTRIVPMSDEEKRTWFRAQIDTALKMRSIESEEDLVRLVRDLRVSFKAVFARDVPGSFIRRLLGELGIQREHSARVQAKRDWMFKQMNDNQALRDNKTQMKKALAKEYGETTLGIVFDELWTEYHSQGEHPEPTKDVDIHGQGSIFTN